MNHFIEFPQLGWKFEISNVFAEFDFFGLHLSIKYYGLLIAIGFLFAASYAFYRAKKLNIDTDAMFDVVFVSTLFAFVGARLYYVFFSSSLQDYLSDPITILYVWQGGLGIYGGIIFAFVTGLIMCKIKKVNCFEIFDLASLGFLIGQAFGRWGNFFNQEAFGGNTTLPWGMTGDMIQSGIHGSGYDLSLPVHPTFFYESLWCIIGFILLHILSKKAYLFKGMLFSGYLIWYGFGRFLIESLRTDSLMIGNIKTSQLVAIAAILLGIILWTILSKNKNQNNISESKEKEENTLDSNSAS